MVFIASERGVWRHVILAGSLRDISLPMPSLTTAIPSGCEIELPPSQLKYARHYDSLSAREGPWSRDDIARRYRPVQLELDSRIRSLVRARKANRSRRGTSSTRDIDLCAFHVQLCTGIGGCRVQRDDLCTEQVSGVVRS